MKLFWMLLLCVPALAQPVALMPNAVKVCDEGGTITASSATSAVTVQFGKGDAWNAPVALGGNVLPLYVYYTNAVLGGDPASGVTKELDVQQQANAYTVTCQGVDGAKTVVDVPALPPPPPPPPPTVKVTLDPKGIQLSNCWLQLANDTDRKEYFTLVCAH